MFINLNIGLILVNLIVVKFGIVENRFFTFLGCPVERFGRTLEEIKSKPSRTSLYTPEPQMCARKQQKNARDNSRKQDIVDVRSLLCYLLREKLNMRWTNIARFFNENGKTMTHGTVIHCVKKYPLHKKHNKDLDKWEKLFTWKSDLTYDEIDQIQFAL